MVASHKPLGRKESLIQIVARRLSSKQRPASSRLGEDEAAELSETSEMGAGGAGGGEGGERKQSLVDMLAARFSRTPRQLKVGGSQIEGEISDESVEGTPETERRESLVKKISRRFSRVTFSTQLQLKLGEEDLEFIMVHTGLEKEAVELHFKQFQRSHPGGVMDPAGLRAMLQVRLAKIHRRAY